MAKRKQTVPTKWWTVTFTTFKPDPWGYDEHYDEHSIEVLAKTTKEAIVIATVKLETNDFISKVETYESDH